MIHFFLHCLMIVFCFFSSLRSELKIFVPKPESSINDLAIEKNITKMWTLGDTSTVPVGIILSDEKFNLELPQKDNETFMVLFNIDKENSENSNNIQIRLFINKILIPDIKKNYYLLSRYLAVLNDARDEILSDFDLIIGRLDVAKEVQKISLDLSKEGRLSLIDNKNKALLQEFSVDNHQIELSKENSLTFPTHEVSELNLAHAYPAVISCITKFAGLGSFAAVKDCTSTSIKNVEKSNDCDHAICSYYGFNNDRVQEQLAFQNKDHSPARVQCQVNVPIVKYQGQGTNEINFLRAISGQDPLATTTPTGAIYKVPAANCSEESKKRACFNNTMVDIPDTAHAQQYAQEDIHGKIFPTQKADCAGNKAEFVCSCSEGENCVFDYDDKGNQIGKYGRETIRGTDNISRRTQEKVCNRYKDTINPKTGKKISKQVRMPAYASCINQSLLKVSTPISCSLAEHLQVDCKLKRYDLAPFSVPVESCNPIDLAEACTIEGTPVAGSCKARIE